MASDPRLAAEQLFQAKYGEVLAALLRFTTYQDFDLAEEAVQTAFQRALEKWPTDGLPQNPAGWLYTVARHAYLETRRRQQTEQAKLAQLPPTPDLATDEDALRTEPTDTALLQDDLATMILLCCTPELSPTAQLCLTLKAACGFSVKEIARALGMQEEAVKKALTRAKEKVAAAGQMMLTLDPDRIASRFRLVLATMYALFNEGYAASGGETQLRHAVAAEAIHLADIFLHTTLTPSAHLGELHALRALMLLHFARFQARSDAAGLPLRLQEQDRTQWNGAMIRAGLAALAASQTSAQVTAFHLEARIAAEHATSPSFAQTRWPTILALYDQLLHFKDTPEVRLSRLVALHHAEGWAAALRELDQVQVTTVAQSFLLHAIRADLLEAAHQLAAAAAEWQQARTHAPTAADRAFIDQKLQKLA
jgi:RNA polymerase sigma-70 factor (ECF subfamily)